MIFRYEFSIIRFDLISLTCYLSVWLVFCQANTKVASKGNLIIENTHRNIKNYQNHKNQYFSTCLVQLLTKYEGDPSSFEISSPDNDIPLKNLGLTPLTLVSVFIPGSYIYSEINIVLSIRSTPNFVSVDSCYKQRNWTSRINRISDNLCINLE